MSRKGKVFFKDSEGFFEGLKGGVALTLDGSILPILTADGKILGLLTVDGYQEELLL